MSNTEMSLEALLAVAEERAAAAEKELEGFAYSVSHDLRGPLRSIMSGAMILEEDFLDKLPAAAFEELARINASARKMSGLIDALLRYSRLGRQEMHVGSVDVSAVADTIAGELTRRTNSVEVTVDPDIRVSADSTLLRTVVLELIENAAKFGARHVWVQRTDGGFSVRDDGIGLSEEHAERIFLPFEKVNGDEYPGAGMGLSLVMRAIVRHHGTVSVSSSPSEAGSVFRVSLPTGT